MDNRQVAESLARSVAIRRNCSDGEPTMLRALARLTKPPTARPASVPALTAEWRAGPLQNYAASTRKDYALMLDKIDAAMRDLNVADLTPHDIIDLRDQWRDRPRTANKYVALLSVLMVYAIERRLRSTNPAREVRKLRESPRRRLLSSDEQLRISAGAERGKCGWKNANGSMYVALFDLAYLTSLRQKDIRLLKWADVGDTDIVVEPTKTRHSSSVKIAFAITPAIRAVLERARQLGRVKSVYVFHTLKGGALSASAIKSAWRRARERAGIKDARFRDLRPKALSDAKRQGVSLEKLRDAAGHTSVTTTEGYLRGFDVKEANLGLSLPLPKKTG